MYALKVICLVLCLSFATAKIHRIHNSELSLLNVMFNSRSALENSPQRSMACFDYYLPKLNAIASEYERSFGICEDNADAARVDVEEAKDPARNKLQEDVDGTCNQFSTCTDESSAIPSLECFKNKASNSAKSMLKVSDDASDILIELREEYVIIDNAEQRCKTEAERIYVQDSSQASADMQDCLNGNSSVPPADTTTIPTTTEDDTTTTEDDTTTTEDDTTTTEDDTYNN
ncbi:uncharacterized protein LOC119665428 [Teleopsis dalmanni]|uniref:uncharacterized protein LOC119665428 n=1 Tax=Teleopsis dalmanni TaxID=139649 RepID=UPI0018CDBF36|nr:uncharacterized protein LOC119665428 [Teleopsis dalmanni]